MSFGWFLLGAASALGAVWAKTRVADFPAQTPVDYTGTGPAIDIREALNGPILCEGAIYGPTGRVAARFVADFEASWDGDTGRMTEHFVYDSGRVQDREWTFTVAGTKITATAPDLVGKGTGKQEGATVVLNYRLRLPKESGGHVLDVTDWMYQVENGTIMNRSQFRMFGLKVGELIATMRPVAVA